jgi:peptidoglycan hydrolase-like protein with peptidoglycan-binding domain
MPEPRRRKAPWVIAVVVLLAAAAVAVAITHPFAAGAADGRGVAANAYRTGIYSVTRKDLSSQIEVPATLGYAGSVSIDAPSGASAQEVGQAHQAVAQDEQALAAARQAESDAKAAGDQAIAADQADVSAASATLGSDQAAEKKACAGAGASTAACSEDSQKVSQDQTALSQARQQLGAARSVAKTSDDQAQAAVGADRVKLDGDRSTLASLEAIAVSPGTTYTWLPAPGEVIREDQPVYAVSDEPVPLLYGSDPVYRAFYVGMSNGTDVAELTRDLITLGYGDGLAESDHYSAATAAAVRRWQQARGLPPTGQILLGAVVFEPGPIRVTAVTPAVGSPAGSGGGDGGSAGASGGGGGDAVLSASSTVHRVSVTLDVGQQSEVAVGDKVTITLPNDENTPGVISSVGTVATAGQDGGSPTITVQVKPTKPAATGDWDQAPVNVTITTETVTNALVVPVDALLAQTDGSYAVEVAAADGSHRLVTVSLGLFDDADGMVQVSGSELAAGQRVVVPNL